MDDLVQKAMEKWPNVPHCYGWLALDARGHWRMRDEHAQKHQLPGQRIHHPALIAFINRNYISDAEGRWYFQNGPQRVYVSLEATPFIARTDPQHEFVLHTGQPLPGVKLACLTDHGNLIFQYGEITAQVDDRDLGQCIANLRKAQDASWIEEQELLSWLERSEARMPLKYVHADREIVVQFIQHEELERIFRFQRIPAPRDSSVAFTNPLFAATPPAGAP